MTAAPALHITDDADADALLSRDPLALLIGMLLDQQVAMETAFSGPLKIEQRLDAEGASFDAESIAAFDEDAFSELCRTPPAIHRYPANMAGRVQVLCRALVDEWDGDASTIWTRDDPDGRTVLARLKALPGFGDQKARIFVALLGKQRGFDGAGWREAAGAYGEEGSFRSVADIVSPESLTKVRETKQAAKAAARASKK
ncbi:HhH-GPD-type base excision DNA repair protein [Rathayibacter oskolensis]|uniref:HhH-GPD-type base excision DNA repair protein n=1 Tax=Rathayibacter TaxID=33886 RepID=UPI0013195ADB|nr:MULTISPECIES: HhH-GPD-type base excision DNA repair protein [Rathayibacter]QHC66169.1 Fe-S cluster assembly protein HesB [Rathayibacter sp. VKM Ac-2759]WKK70965.1 HhH-GPD-type base excision DNA repair protein [Rathayibacter oskolensis]